MIVDILIISFTLLLIINYPDSSSMNRFEDEILIALDKNGKYFSPSSINTSIWMEELLPYIGDLHLLNLTLPGTHDSASFTLTSSLSVDPTGSAVLDALVKLAEKLKIPLKDVITPWALTQNRSLYEQAVDGMRYFDIRATHNGTDWCSYHFELGLPIYIHLSALSLFLSLHKNEMMIIEVTHLPTENLTQNKLNQLRDMIINIFDSMLYSRINDFNSMTINYMIKTNQRVIVTLNHNATIENYTQLWYNFSLINSYADTDSLKKMTLYNWQQVVYFNSFPSLSTSALYKLSWILTPQVSTVFDSVLPGRPKSLRSLADIANKGLSAFSDIVLNKGWKLCHLLLIDYQERSEIMEIIFASILSATL